MVRIHDRLVPDIHKAFQFLATRMERYIVACYDGSEGGHFSAHRDNTTKGTAHRRFAVSLNLNTGQDQGGDSWFPEFGRLLYRPPLGGAVVFSCSLLHEATPVTPTRADALRSFRFSITRRPHRSGARISGSSIHSSQQSGIGGQEPGEDRARRGSLGAGIRPDALWIPTQIATQPPVQLGAMEISDVRLMRFSFGLSMNSPMSMRWPLWPAALKASIRPSSR